MSALDLFSRDFLESRQGALWIVNPEKAGAIGFSITIVAMKTSLEAVLEGCAFLLERVAQDCGPLKESVAQAIADDLPDITDTLELKTIARSLVVDSVLLTAAPRSPLSAEITMHSAHAALVDYTIDSHFLPDGQFLGINIES